MSKSRVSDAVQHCPDEKKNNVFIYYHGRVQNACIAMTTACALPTHPVYRRVLAQTPSNLLTFLLILPCDHHYDRVCKSHDGFTATNADGKIVGVSFVDVHAKGSNVATLGPVASLAPGAGSMTFVAACAHAEKLGFSTLVRCEGNTTLDALDVLAQEESLGGSRYDVFAEWTGVRQR